MKATVLSVMLIAGACSNGQATSQPAETHNRQQLVTAPAAIAPLGRVSDHAGILTAAQEAEFSARLEALELKTQHQMAIVTVASLNGEDVADYTLTLFNSWGVGRAGHNDGVVLLVAPNERKVRITVGYGLEETLPDALCKEIIDSAILPRFRENDLPGGIEAGTDALVKVLT